MKLIDYLPYYLGCDAITTDDNETAELVGVTDDDAHLVHKGTGSYGTCSVEGIKPILRRLSDMTNSEIICLLNSVWPPIMEDKPKEEEYSLEVFKGDGGNLVNSDVVIGANYSVRYFEGTISIKNCGTICFYDGAGDEQEGTNVPAAYHYLLRQHFDLFNLIDTGLAIDIKTIGS